MASLQQRSFTWQRKTEDLDSIPSVAVLLPAFTPLSSAKERAWQAHKQKCTVYGENSSKNYTQGMFEKHSGDHQGKPFPFSSHWEVEKGSEIQDSNFRKERASPRGLRHSLILKSSGSQVFPRSAHRSSDNHGAKRPGSTLP